MSTDYDAHVGRYANILLDYWFKRTFGTEARKRLLQLFLQEVIPERQIKELTYAPQEHVNPFPGRKDIRVDVECTDQTGARFVVEMQLAGQDAFYDRAVYNASFAVQEQMSKGVGSYRVPPVYFIGIMDFSFHKGSDRVRYEYRLTERSSGELMTECVQFIFLELPNCRKALTPEATILDNFCYALHNMPSLPDRPAELESEIFRLLFESAEIATFAPKEKVKYENDMTTERDIRNQIAYARQEGRAEGREEGQQDGLKKGLAQGREEGRAEGETSKAEQVALAMRKAGESTEKIALYTGLTPEQIQAL
jgi:predicted transposase/invertase (TIGR01784 family)